MYVYRLIVIVCCLSAIACQNGGTRNDRNTADNGQKFCFLRLEGTQLQDSSYIQLIAQNETVSGVYHVIPHEKDARRGTVTGKLDGDVFDLVWTYSQEGMQDTLRVVFKLDNGELLRKPLSVDTLTGRQFTSDTSPFSEVYQPMDCSANEAGYAGSL